MKFFLLVVGASFCPLKGEHSEIKACQLFKVAEAKQNKIYNSTGERNQAYVNFLENLHQMEEVEVKFPGAKFSADGPFFDWSISQWKARNNLKYKDYKLDHSKIISEENLKKADEENFSWVEQGGVNAVQDQGQCGSCWSFSSIANIEGVHFHQSKNLYKLSESELVDCMDADNGCNGGLPSYTDDELKEKHMGLELESAYPYEPEDRTCSYDASIGKVFVMEYGVLEQSREDLMQEVLVTFGPLSVGVNANPLMYYTDGVLDPENPEDCDPSGIDHAVTVTGYGHEDGKSYWEIRNSWGPGWGIGGYFHLIRDKNACGVSDLVSTVTKTAEDRPIKEITA
jgi:cathepsin F